MGDYEFVKVEKEDHLLIVTLNRPENYNALHGPAHKELHEIWDAYEADKDLWVAIVTGAGDKAFCSGNDLKATAMGGDISSPPSGFGGLTSRLDREKPIIAAVNGVAMGGGMEIALSTDLIVAASNAKFALPEVKVGLFAAASGVQRLTRNIGRKMAMEMILTGRHVLPEEAKDLGIVNRVSSKEGSGVMEDARALAEEILAVSPSSVRASKRVLNEYEAMEPLSQSLDATGKVMMELMQTQDFQEGVQAFVAKRKPEWKNA